MGTVGICPKQLFAENDTVNKLCNIVLFLFYDIDCFEKNCEFLCWHSGLKSLMHWPTQISWKNSMLSDKSGIK